MARQSAKRCQWLAKESDSKGCIFVELEKVMKDILAGEIRDFEEGMETGGTCGNVS